MENSCTQTIFVNDKTFNLWNALECSKFIKVYSPKEDEDSTKKKRMYLSRKRLSRKKSALRRRQIKKVMKIMRELSSKGTPIIHEPDDSIDVKEFIQYPSNVIDSELSNFNQNIEDISQNCIKIKEEYPENYNGICIRETEEHNEIKMEQLQNNIVDEPLKKCNDIQTDELQNWKTMKIKHPQNCKEIKQKCTKRKTEQPQSSKELKTGQSENCEEIKEMVLLKDNYKINITKLQNSNQPEETKNVENDNQSSTSEYVPSDYVLSENEQDLDNELSQKRRSSLNKTSISSLDTSQIGSSVCNDELMYVEASNTKSGKKNYCLFCTKLQSKLARHLETVHCNEPDVKKFSVLPKKNPERKKIIETIRRNGNFKFNTDSKINNGQLIVCRRPNEKYDKRATDFIACAKCKGFFTKNSIRHHSRKCFKRDFKTNKCIMIMGRKITSRIHPLANDILRKKVLPIMREDDVTRIVRYDELLIMYANTLCIKYKSEHHHDMIRARLRILGRFLIALRNINLTVDNFELLYCPKIYDDCISAINIVARYNEEEKMYEAPAVAANLSTLIKHIGNLLIIKCIKIEDAKKKEEVKDFLKLLVVDIGTNVNRTVMETQSAHKKRKINLPSLEDIERLYRYLKEKRTEHFKALHTFFTYYHWVSLAEVTLTSVHVFNRRRTGEIERIAIEDFQNYQKLSENIYGDIYKSLSSENRKIAEKYVRFCIKRKLGRTVPVLLSKDLLQCIQLILKFRKEAEVPDKNPYVFGLPSVKEQKYRYLRACALMRKFATECNAMHSTTLRGTILRKHMATYFIQLNLNDIDVFMDHSDKIHKDHYRKPLPSRDILKVSQYLEAVQGDTHEPNDDSSSDSDIRNEDDKGLKDVNSKDNISFANNDINVTPDTSVLLTSDDFTVHNKQDTNKRKRSTSPYGKIKRTRWSQREKEIALQVFSQYMKDLKLPSLREIQNVKKKYTSLAQRTSPQIKTWLHNQQKALRQLQIRSEM